MTVPTIPVTPQAMSFEQMRAGLLFLGGVAVWAFGLSTVWNKLIARVNGLGGRTKKVEEGTAKLEGRVDEIKEHQTTMELRLAEENAELRQRLSDREGDYRERLRAVETRLEIMFALLQQVREDEQRTERERLDR